MADEYLTVAEIAEVLKLNQQTIRNWIAAGKLPALHLGRRVRVKRSDFEQLLREAELPNGEPKDVRDGSPSIWEGNIPMPEVPVGRNAQRSFRARQQNGVKRRGDRGNPSAQKAPRFRPWRTPEPRSPVVTIATVSRTIPSSP